MKRIKILQIATMSSWGGAPQVVFDLIKNLSKEHFDVELACGAGSGWEKMKSSGVKIHILPNMRRGIDPLRDLKTIWALYRIIKKRNYDIVHCHSTKAGLVGRFAAKFAGVKKIYFTVHGWGFYNSEYRREKLLLILLEKVMALLSSKIICVSKNDYNEGLKNKIAPQDKMVVVYNGIDWQFSADRAIVRANLKLNNQDIVFGFVARLVEQKNPQLLLQSAAAVFGRHKNAKLIIAGDGPLMAECRKLSENLKINDSVIFLGELSNKAVRRLMVGFDVFVLPSRFEGLPLTIIEAMFAGLPIIASDVGGIPELIVNSKNGFLVNNDDAAAFAAKIEYFIENQNMMQKMGDIGREIAYDKFNLKKMIENYQNLYYDE